MSTVANGARGRGALIALLVSVGVIAMAVSMVMNWRFGWGLAADQMDRFLMAVLHSLVDPGAAALIAAGSLMLAWGLRWQGWASLGFAVLLIAYSMISVYGFMSERIGQLAGHKAALELQKGHMDWLGKQRVSWDVPRAERKTMREDMKVAMDKLAASVRIIPDRHAVAIAGGLGSLGFNVTVEGVQRGLVMAGSSVAQGIKFMCLSIGFFLWGIGAIGRQPDRKTQDGLGGTSGGTSGTSGGGSGSDTPRLTVVPKKAEPEPTAIRAAGTSTPEPIVVPTGTRMFQARVAGPSHGTSSVDDADDRVSNGGKGVKAAAPKRKRKAKVPFDQMRRAVRASLVHGERTRTIRDIGEETGWSHTHVLRQIEREEGIQGRKQKHLPIRRDPRGLGASLH